MRRSLLTVPGGSAPDQPMFTNQDSVTITYTPSTQTRGHKFTPTTTLTVTGASVRVGSAGTYKVSIWRVSDHANLASVAIDATGAGKFSGGLSATLSGGTEYLVTTYDATSGQLWYSTDAPPMSSLATLSGGYEYIAADAYPTSHSTSSFYWGVVNLTVHQ